MPELVRGERDILEGADQPHVVRHRLAGNQIVRRPPAEKQGAGVDSQATRRMETGGVREALKSPPDLGISIRHIAVDEASAPEFYTGAKLEPIDGPAGKIDSKKGRGTTIVVDVPLVKKEKTFYGKD